MSFAHSDWNLRSQVGASLAFILKCASTFFAMMPWTAYWLYAASARGLVRIPPRCALSRLVLVSDVICRAIGSSVLGYGA